LTYKSGPDQGLVETREYEVEVGDADEMMRILLEMGYEHSADLRKERRKVEIPPYTICLDDVECLGSFIEIERMLQDEDERTVEEIEHEILAKIVELGLSGYPREPLGYGALIDLYYNAHEDARPQISEVELHKKSKKGKPRTSITKEVEVKARVGNKNNLLDKITEYGIKLEAPILQDDAIWIPPDVTMQYVYGDSHLDWAAYLERRIPVIRLRTQTSVQEISRGETGLMSGSTLLTLKIPLSNELDNEEYEVSISDKFEMAHLLDAIGYHAAIRFQKIRQKGRWGDYETCVDELSRVGTFLELEKIISDGEESGAVQEELMRQLAELGISRDDCTESGYDTLVYREEKKAGRLRDS